MRAQEVITELFDQVYQWDWTIQDSNNWLAEFVTEDGRDGEVDFNEASEDNWSVDFTIDGQYHITGGGDAIAIFSTVQDAVIDFLNQTGVNNLRFKADQEGGSSRSKFYQRWAQRMANAVGMQLDSKRKGTSTVFHMYRNIEESEIQKPHPDDTLGVERKHMPQVHRDHYPELIKYLEDHGNKFSHGEMHAKELKATQKEFSDKGVRKMMKTGGRPSDSAGKAPKPLIVSSDNYILDGHHRWLAAWNQDDVVPVMKGTLPIKKLFQLVNDFEHTTYKDIHEEVSSNEKEIGRQGSNRN